MFHYARAILAREFCRNGGDNRILSAELGFARGKCTPFNWGVEEMLRSRFSYGLVLAPLLMGLALTGCKNKKPPETDPVDQPVAVLGIQAVRPAQGRTDEPTRITISGSGFDSGAKVFIGDMAARNVAVDGSKTLAATVPEGMAPNEYVVTVRNPDGKEATLPRGFRIIEAVDNTVKDCSVETIYFDFDDSTLNDASRMSLQTSVDCLKARNVGRVRVEGHADERGSTDYNLALGQRRAESVRSYLGKFGYSSSNVTTISYGEERPADPGTSEASWAHNRRVEIVILE